MRKIFSSTVRASAITARLASPFLRRIEAGASSSASGTARAADARRVPHSNREFADAAIRSCRTLW